MVRYGMMEKLPIWTGVPHQVPEPMDQMRHLNSRKRAVSDSENLTEGMTPDSWLHPDRRDVDT
jgi:hypothetical protein